jgi:hypothetical protein
MTLEDKKKAAELEPKVAEFAGKLKELTGKEIAVDVQWESFAGKMPAYNGLPRVFKDLVDGFTLLCADAIGKEAVAGKIAKLELAQANDKGVLSETGKVVDGTLRFDWDFSRMAILPKNLVKHLERQL